MPATEVPAMRQSDPTFEQVKSLLRRMDSSIEEARERRRAKEAVSQSNSAQQKATARNPEAQAIRDRLREIGRPDNDHAS
jgi:hypothetical protein